MIERCGLVRDKLTGGRVLGSGPDQKGAAGPPFDLARLPRLERGTLGLEVRCSIH